MIRALQTAGVHTWVIFRVAFSRKYWLGTTAALFAAGVFLWIGAAFEFPPLDYHSNVNCSSFSGVDSIFIFASGVAIAPWCRPEFAESPPLPIRPSLRRLLATVLSLFLALFMAIVAIPLMLAQIVIIRTAIELGWGLMLLDPFFLLERISKAFRRNEWMFINMGIVTLCAFPVSLLLSVSPQKWTDTKRRLRDVLPHLLGLGLAAVGTALAIDALEHHQFCQHATSYLSVWLVGFVCAFCGVALHFGGRFLASLWRDMHRKGLTGHQQLIASLKRSQLIK